MRQLKYRIWDNQNRHWITENGYSLHCNSNWAICPFTGKLTDYVGMEGEFGEVYIASPAPDCYMQGGKIVKEPRYVLMQYTGLKDKNGNLIYEGDIVKYARTKVESIEFAKNCFKNNLIELGEEIGEIIFIKPSFCISFNHIRYDDIMLMCLAEHRYEVIGNIFETPELLK